MTELLRPYVPSLVIDWLRDRPATAHRRVEGSFVFADISGFTNLTERLAARGKVGAEEMGDLLNETFESLLIPAYIYGGALVKWGGDAVLLLFTDDDTHPHRAARAACEMQRVIKRVGRLKTSAGTVTLRMSVGVHTGSLDFFLAGGHLRELVVAGPGATTVAEMEKIAEAGEIMLSAPASWKLGEEHAGEARGGGRLLVGRPDAPEQPRTSTPPGPLPDLGAAVSAPVRDYLLGGAVENEHRQVVAGFTFFSGTDRILGESGPEVLATELSAIVDTAAEAAERFGVTLLGSDVAADGGKLIFAAGAPLSRGDGADRLLAALRAVLEAPTSLTLRAGANAGRVFSGDFGPPYRRTYSVVGDSVNLAARLMAHAQPGQLVVTRTTTDEARTPFALTPLPPFRVKGKTEPIDAVVVGPPAATAEKASADDAPFPFVGRDSEVTAILGALAVARDGGGRLLEIVAEAGLGKSRLVEEVFDEAGVGRLQVACDVYEVSSPYASIARFLRGLLGLAPDDPPDVAATRLRDVVVDRCPHLLPWLPLLAAASRLDMPSTPEVDALAERFRSSRLGQSVVDFVRSLTDRPCVFVFEDVHHMDEASAEILGLLEVAVPDLPVLLVVTRRPTGTGFVARDAAHVEAMWLTPLPDEATGELLNGASEDIALLEHELAQIRENAGGNPLYLRELLAARQHMGSLDALPDSLEGVIIAKIDALPTSARRLLRAAAVLGMTVNRPMLESVLVAEDVLVTHDDWLDVEPFLAVDGSEHARFRHALVREAAYESLPFRRRRELHGHIGDALEQQTHLGDEELLPALSFHFHSAQRHEASLRYSRRAGDLARANYAHVEAARFYERAYGAARRLPATPGAELADLAETLGDAWFTVGELAKASELFKAAYRLVRTDPVQAALRRLKMAKVAVRTGRYPEALRIVSRGLAPLEGVEHVDAVAAKAQLTTEYAFVRHMQGRERDTLTWGERAVELAGASDATDALAQAYQLIDWADLMLGKVGTGDYARRALAIWEERGDLLWQAIVLNHLGMRAYWTGDWPAALDYYERARSTSDHVGDQWRAAQCAANIAEIYVDQGRLAEAEELTRRALRVFRSIGVPYSIALAEVLLGRIEARNGDYEEALRLLESARSLHEAGGAGDVVEADARVAECLVLDGRAEEALALAEQVLSRMSEGEGFAAVAPLLHRARGLAYAQRGEYLDARAALESSLIAARLRRASHEVAFTIDAMVWVAQAADTTVHPDLIAERDTTFEQLGVVAVVHPPLGAPSVVLPRPREVVADVVAVDDSDRAGRS